MKKEEVQIRILNFLKENNYQIEKLFKPQTTSPSSIEDYVLEKNEEEVRLELNPKLEKILHECSEKEITEAITELIVLLVRKLDTIDDN